jgi:cobalamin synthase
MIISRQFALGIVTVAILVSLGFVTVSHSVDQSHTTPFLHYFWMVLSFLIAMAVMICADLAFEIASDGWRSPSRAVRYSKRIGSWAVSALVLWLAFWHQHVFLWIVFALALVVLFWIRFGKHSMVV